MPYDLSKIQTGVKMPVHEDTSMLMSRTATAVITNSPFFASLWFTLSPAWSYDHETAWVNDKHHVFVNPTFFGQGSKEESGFILIHEIQHVTMFHIDRARRFYGADMLSGEQMKEWNFAADALINDWIEHEFRDFPTTFPTFSADGPAGPNGKPMWRKGDKCGVSLDRGFVKDETVESLVIKLRKDREENPQGGNAEQYEIFQPDMKQDGKGSGGGDDGEQDGGSASPGGTVSKGVLDAQMRAAVAGALDAARKQGKVPAGLERLLEGVLVPEKDYRSLLMDAFMPVMGGKGDYSWKRTNRHYRAMGVMAPSLCMDLAYRKVGFLIDTSGSQSDEDIALCVGSAMMCAAQVGVQEMVFAYVDTKIHRVDRVQIGEAYEPANVPGRGGTDFDEAFEFFTEEENVDALIVLTDLYVTPPPQPECPVVWVTTVAQSQAPYGALVCLR